MDALQDPKTWDTRFKPAEIAALRLADAITRGNGHVADEVWNDVAAHYDDGSLIELVGVIGLFNYFNRFNNALEIQVTRPGWPTR